MRWSTPSSLDDSRGIICGDGEARVIRRINDACLARRGCLEVKPLPPASQAVVPHVTFAVAAAAAPSGWALRSESSGHWVVVGEVAVFAALRLRQRSSTSAERSEAREDDFGSSATFRVASPLVMATRGRDARRVDVLLARRACLQVTPLPPASQGVVPHDTTHDADVERSGFAALRLRQGSA